MMYCIYLYALVFLFWVVVLDKQVLPLSQLHQQYQIGRALVYMAK
jgi:hypothetical protein